MEQFIWCFKVQLAISLSAHNLQLFALTLTPPSHLGSRGHDTERSDYVLHQCGTLLEAYNSLQSRTN